MKNFLDKATEYKQSTNNFKFYVSADKELQELDESGEEISLNRSKPKLLEGEIIITEGNRVLFFPNVAEKTKGLSGNLYVTNFRFIFDSYEEDSSIEDDSIQQKNLLLGKHSACLTNIESLFHFSGEKKKKLIQDSQLTEKVKKLQIVCKNFKVFTFNFDQSPITQGKNIAKTLLHHAFPGRHQLLFAYDFRNSKPDKPAEKVVLFSERSEWENELTRTCPMTASNWRISTQNNKFQMSTSLPKWLIVPHSVLDYDFVTASQSFRCNRPPIWTWSNSNGAALVRMADLLPSITDRTQENRMLENVRKCHPHLKGPCIKYLDKDLPSYSELFQSYAKLRDLCTPESHRQFKLQESHLYSAIENTKWLQYVSSCLKVVVEAALEIQRGTTVVLQESDGRDTSAVVSSLVQLVLDPHTRSIVGFQSLIQKEWVALGHPFCGRLGHVRKNNSEQSPMFLLFLDCVWQLQNQFPSSFEFTETYLTSLWDSVHISVFDTFLFDCEKDRIDAFLSQNERLEPRSIWNWNIQFTESDIDLFVNPLYKFSQLKDIFISEVDKSPEQISVLLPEFGLPCIELWTQCYFRWLPLLSIKSGGRPQVDIIHRHLLKDIQSLLIEIQEFSKKNIGNYVHANNQNFGQNINSVNNNINNNLNNNNSPPADGNNKNNIIHGVSNNCSTSTNNETPRGWDFSRVMSTEFSSKSICDKNGGTLFKIRNNIDNFFPFTLNSVNIASSKLTNSSNISGFDTHSVLNLTE